MINHNLKQNPHKQQNSLPKPSREFFIWGCCKLINIITFPLAIFADLTKFSLWNYPAFCHIFKCKPLYFIAEFQAVFLKARSVKASHLFIIGAKLSFVIRAFTAKNIVTGFGQCHLRIFAIEILNNSRHILYKFGTVPLAYKILYAKAMVRTQIKVW